MKFRLRALPLTAFSVLTATALVVSGCTTGTLAKAEEDKALEATVQQAPEGFEQYYAQKIEWRACTAEEVVPYMMPTPADMKPYECATLTAPMDWSDPSSESIELFVARHVNSNKNAPALFYNLGGPGGGAADSLAGVIENVLTPELTDHFQIVALDPRGVGKSSPVQCRTDEEKDQDNSEYIDYSDLTVDELIAEADKEVAELGAECLDKTGTLLGFVDSDSATRDFDMVRAILTQPKFDYIGFSYGTVIGATYAELFPDHVGRLVLDGAVDPALSGNDLSYAQIDGMEKSLYHWIEECQKIENCPVAGDLESGKQQMIEFLTGLQTNPLPTADPDRPLTATLAYTAIIGSMYSTEMYPLLTQGMTMAKLGDGSLLLFLADYYNGRNDDGTYRDNSDDAFTAINYLDYEPTGTPEEWKADADRIAREYPVLGADWGLGSAGEDKWPVEGRVNRHKITAPGTPEILVIGTTNDPATPYFMAQNLANDLEKGVLITVDGWNHTAYSATADKCVVDAVDGFLLKGTVPAEGLTCQG